jgi:hypothetical protein
MLLFSIVHYIETLFIGCKSTWIEDQLLSHLRRYGIRIIYVCDISIDFQFGNIFYCSIFTMIQGDFLEVLKIIAYDEKLTQIDRCTIL